MKNVLGKTQAECRAKLAAAMEEIKNIDVSRADEYTVATWLRSWYELYAKPNVRVATAGCYRLMIDTYTLSRIGHIKLSKLTTQESQKLCKETKHRTGNRNFLSGVLCTFPYILTRTISREKITKTTVFIRKRWFFGAAGQIRTADLILTKRFLMLFITISACF